jgi:hypothetical protein
VASTIVSSGRDRLSVEELVFALLSAPNAESFKQEFSHFIIDEFRLSDETVMVSTGDHGDVCLSAFTFCFQT